MKLKVFWSGNLKAVKTKSKTVGGLLGEMSINPEIVIVSVNGRIVPEQTKLKDSDRVEILKVVSGG